MNLGENIYRFRTAKNMSQGDLADALNVSRQSVSKWENNSATPELEKLMRMGELFGVSLDELVSGRRAEPHVQTVNVEKQCVRFTRREIAGIVFWCFAALIVLAYALAREGLSGLLPALPLLFCGYFYYTNTKHPALGCAWVLCFPLMILFSAGYIRADLSNLANLCIKLPLLFFTLHCLRNDEITLTRPLLIFLLIGYLLWFGYIMWFILRLFTTDVYDTAFSYFTVCLIDTCAFALFTGLLSVTTRFLKRK